jgi:hypothetical protein
VGKKERMGGKYREKRTEQEERGFWIKREQKQRERRELKK